MKNRLNKFLKIFFVIIFIIIPKSYAIEDVSELTDAINEARDEFNNVSEASAQESKIIDEAIKEIDKATEYVQEAINNNATNDAIKTLEFIEKSLADVEKIIPQEFSSDMSKIDTSSIAKEDMDTINELTSQMSVSQEEKLNAFMSDLVDLNQKGIDTVSISKNLNSLGVETVNLVLDVSKSKEMETWTKEQWAESYKGSILTSTGSEIVTDKEISNKVVNLEQKLQANNMAILDKRTSLIELQTKIDPLSNQIEDLKSQKTDLMAKYNKEILKQSSTILSDQEINQSKELANQLNNQLGNITNEIKAAEKQSNSLQQKVQGLNLDLTSEIANKTQLENNIKSLNNQLSVNRDILSQKTSELDQLKNTDLNSKINSLNENLQSVSRERDFIETQFERSIDLEVQAVERYYSALGDIDSKYFDQEVDFTIREVGVIMDNDPRRARAFEFEKFATYAGFSGDFIQEGITSIKNDNWGRQKELYKEVTTKLAKNPEWQVDIPSNAELNVMIEEEKAIQAAALASMDIDRINKEWNEKINKQLKEVGPEAGLNISTLKYAATSKGMREHEFIQQEYDKLISESNLEEKINNLNSASKNYTDYMATNWNSPKNKGKYDLTKALSLQTEYFKASNTVSDIERTTASLARQNVIERAVAASAKYNEIISQVNPDRAALEQKVTNILKEVPTFADDAERLAGLDPASLRAKLTDIINGNKNESKALEAARRAMAEVGKSPVGNLTGPTWQMTNVKAAAIVRSKKYDHVDDYAYINAEYKDPLNLNSKDREYVESELKGLLGQENVKLEALNNKVSNLTSELNSAKTQSQNLTAEISNLESELSSLKKSESTLKNQINDLTKEFNSKENLISEKAKNLASLQEQLNPLSEKMNKLQGQRADLNTKLSDQLNSITSQIETKGQVTDKTNELKSQLESQIAELDNQLKDYESQSKEINSQLTSLTNELSALETKNPEIANQIESLTNDLKSYKDIKADLAMATAKKLGLNVNEKAIKSVELVDNKVIVALNGTEVVKIFDKNMLIDQATNLVDPISTISKTTLYSPGALNRNLITKEFLEASKSISVLDKVDVLSQATAIEVAGASAEQSAKMASAKAARLSAREAWDSATAAGDKVAAQAAEDAFMAAKAVEQEISQQAAAAAAAASVASAQAAAAATTVAAEAAAEAATAAAAEVQDTVEEATRAAQQAALDALWEMERMPGSSGFHTQEITAAIKQLESEMHGTEYNYLGQSSYEDAMKEIERMEKTGKSVVECMSQAGC